MVTGLLHHIGCADSGATIQLTLNITVTKNIIMKIINIIIVSLIVFASCKTAKLIHANSSTTKAMSTDTLKKTYNPIADSLGYMKEIVANKQKYINKELAVLLKDLKIEPKSYTAGNLGKMKYNSIYLSFDDWNTTSDKMRNTKNLNFKKPCELQIVWVTPLNKADVWKDLKRATGEWTDADRAYYSQLIVADIFSL